ncbi:hypothetical protein ACQVPL_20080 [Bacillus hominis]|uniref:hypothetical protein n=1 Tax=Bacillus hominis TaxID=2817478 RepID=UPI003D662E46
MGERLEPWIEAVRAFFSLEQSKNGGKMRLKGKVMRRERIKNKPKQNPSFLMEERLEPWLEAVRDF